MKATILSIQPFQSQMHRLLVPEFFQVMIDLPFSLSSEIAGPGYRVSLVSVGGEQIEIEGRLIFPKKSYELTELAVFKPLQAGLKVGSVWEVAFPSFSNP